MAATALSGRGSPNMGRIACSLVRPLRIAAFAACAGAMFTVTTSANPLPFFFLPAPQTNAALPQHEPGDVVTDGADDATTLPSQFQRQIVDYRTHEAAGTIVIDTPNTYLYFVLGNGRALRYGIGVGREGFAWSGTQTITRKAEWGARAMYLGGTIYRIHGTNQPQTIGGRVSSGCIRMVNDDVIDLYGRARVGTKVVVLPAERRAEMPASIPHGTKSSLY